MCERKKPKEKLVVVLVDGGREIKNIPYSFSAEKKRMILVLICCSERQLTMIECM